MKKSIYTLGLIAGIALMSCQTPAQKEEAAEANLQTAKENLATAKQDLNAEYPSFRKDADQQITDNEKEITSLRAKLDKDKTPLDNVRRQKIEDLEKQNADLRSKLYGYEKERTDWLAFKQAFNRDRDKLRDAFRDFGDDLKK
jgi:Skp family chaperone for outer membrane proteins